MGVIATPTAIPGGGVPDAVMIAKLRKGMAGCGACAGMEGFDGMDGMDAGYTGTGEELALSVSAPVTSYWSGGGFLQDLTKGTLSIVSSVLTPPAYRSVSPGGGITEIRTGGSVNYPATGPTALPVTGISTTTMLMLGLAAMVLISMQRGR